VDLVDDAVEDVAVEFGERFQLQCDFLTVLLCGVGFEVGVVGVFEDCLQLNILSFCVKGILEISVVFL
jgi:hypothetical protein